MKYMFTTVGSMGLLVLVVLWARPEAHKAPYHNMSALNPFVIQAVQEYPQDRSVKVVPTKEAANTLGFSRDIIVNSRKVFPASTIGSHCSGFTMEVYFRAMAISQGRDSPAMDTLNRRFADFRKKWAGVDGNRQTLVRALTEYKLGTAIRIEDVKPGDFIQFWRNNGTGHSAILEQLYYGGDSLLAIRFSSVHKGMGVSSKVEAVGPERSAIDRSQIFVARANRL
jgi:hypothetical protein